MDRSRAYFPTTPAASAPATLAAVVALIAAAALAALTSLSARAGDGDRADELISFKLKDQHENLITDGRYRGTPLVVSWADKSGSSHLDAWLPALHDTLATELRTYRLHILDIASATGVPFFIKGMVKSKMKEKAASPVLLDWGGKFKKAYGCTPDHMNLILFDRESRFVAIFALAEFDSTLYSEVIAKILGLL